MTSESKDKTIVSNFKKKTANTVFFRYSPVENSITRKQFESFFSDIGPVKKCSLIRQEKRQSETNKRDAKGFGFCKFTCEEDAVSAAKTLNETHLQLDYGQKVQVWVELADDSVATEKGQEKVRSQTNTLPEGTPGPEAQAQSTDDIMALQNKKRTSRVILRNLSFYASEHNIRQVMEQQFGEVVEINLPLVPTLDESNDANKKKKRPQHRGFAFVTFANKIVAQKAVNACSGDGQVLIKNRPVAIDFSVSKVQHKRMKQEEMDGGDNTDSQSESDNDEEKLDNENENDKNDDVKSNDVQGDSNDESEDDESESSQSASDDDDDDDDDDVSMDDIEKGKEDDAATTPKDSHNNSVFLRNLPFDTTRHDLFTLFSKYGHIDGIYLVKDRETGIEKGTGFIKFRNEGGCLRALEAGKGGEVDKNDFKAGKNMLGTDVVSGGIYLKGRRIFVDMAVDRNTADSLKVQRDENGKPIDKRLARTKETCTSRAKGAWRVMKARVTIQTPGRTYHRPINLSVVMPIKKSLQS
jgi:RNA-binding proteins (RRM domain)